MASVFNYNFDQTTRLGYDRTDFSQHILQNSEYANYMLDGFRPACPLKNAIDFATVEEQIIDDDASKTNTVKDVTPKLIPKKIKKK